MPIEPAPVVFFRIPDYYISTLGLLSQPKLVLSTDQSIASDS